MDIYFFFQPQQSDNDVRMFLKLHSGSVIRYQQTFKTTHISSSSRQHEVKPCGYTHLFYICESQRLLVFFPVAHKSTLVSIMSKMQTRAHHLQCLFTAFITNHIFHVKMCTSTLACKKSQQYATNLTEHPYHSRIL